MKKLELVKIIRSAVRQELNASLPKIVAEILSSSLGPNESSPVELVKEALRTETKVSPVKKKPATKRYSNNEALNQVLNETVGGIPTEGPRVGEEPQLTDLQGQAVDADSLPDHLTAALTRNYSDVLKLVDKKRGTVA
jgi:hypothetical protein